MPYTTVGIVAKRLGVMPWQIAYQFTAGRLRDDLCPVVSGRRMIPEDYVDQIAAALKRQGLEVRSVEAATR